MLLIFFLLTLTLSKTWKTGSSQKFHVGNVKFAIKSYVIYAHVFIYGKLH